MIMPSNPSPIAKKNQDLVQCRYCSAMVRDDRLALHISKYHQVESKKAVSPKKTVKNEQSNEDILVEISHLTQRNPIRFIRGFEQYVEATISIRRLLSWLRILTDRGAPLTYKNIAELRDEQTRAVLANSPKRRSTAKPAIIAQPPQAPSKATTEVYKGGCLCKVNDRQILTWIQSQTIPEEALVEDCCWVRICQVRGRYSGVEDETWEEICRTRGYLKYAGGLFHQ
jgi:hypothetical protein